MNTGSDNLCVNKTIHTIIYFYAVCPTTVLWLLYENWNLKSKISFQIFVLVILFGLFNGLVFLPVLLGLMGPVASPGGVCHAEDEAANGDIHVSKSKKDLVETAEDGLELKSLVVWRTFFGKRSSLIVANETIKFLTSLLHNQSLSLTLNMTRVVEHLFRQFFRKNYRLVLILFMVKRTVNVQCLFNSNSSLITSKDTYITFMLMIVYVHPTLMKLFIYFALWNCKRLSDWR